MAKYNCGSNRFNHVYSVEAVSLSQAKYKCKLLHGFYPDWAEQQPVSYIPLDAYKHEKQIDSGRVSL